MSNLNDESQKFAEWRIMRDQINEFVKLLRKRSLGNPHIRFDAFGVGSPRNCAVVVTAKLPKATLRKALVVNISLGDCTTWEEPFDAQEWEMIERF